MLSQQINTIYRAILQRIDVLLQPNPKYVKSSLQREIAHRRNKAIFLICFSVQFIFLYDIFINNNPILNSFASIAAIYFTCLVLILSCRYHPQIFNTFYTLISLLYGPAVMNAGDQNIAYAFIAANFMAVLIQAMTGSYTQYMMQVITQAILVNTVYQRPLLNMIASNSPENVLRYLTHSSTLTLIIQTVVVILIHRFLAQAQQKAFAVEQKKNEAENQRTFLLSFSHELRNLINSLTGNVKLASLENIQGRARDFLLNAEVCGEMLLHMINNILDSGKATIGELEINPVPTKTYESFERIWGICSEIIRRKDLRGYMKIPKNMPDTLMIDQHRLTQIFLNLVGNAIKFTDKGSIDITLTWLSHQVRVTENCFQPYPFNDSDEHDEGLFEKQQSFTSLDNEYITLSKISRRIDTAQLTQPPATRQGVLKIIITDTGCGMSKEQTDQLFQKFTQVTTDSSKKKLGTGLGLFITKQLCQKMNGEIKVFSQKGKGSSFIICIPAEVVFINNQVMASQESMRRYLATRNLQAMIVDDAPDNHVILQNFFQNLGISVRDIMLNGLEAYQKYLEYVNRNNRPQIIVMDLDMPIMNGKEASRKIRNLETERRLRPVFLVIISGNCIDSEITECLDKEGTIRADAFLRKPITIEDLTRVIAAYYVRD